MSWLQSHQTLARHPKTLRAAKLLNVSIPAVIGHLHLLWWWCLDYAEDGDLGGLDNSEIAQAALWPGEPQAFVEALLNAGASSKAGFLEHSSNGHLVVHDWDEYAGILIDRRKRNAQYKRDVRRMSAGHPRDVSKMSGAIVKESKVKESKVKEEKKGYGEFKNVLLSDKELQKLKARFGERLNELIEALSIGIESKGYKYKRHYATLLAWEKKDRRDALTPKAPSPPGPRRAVPPADRVYPTTEEFRHQVPREQWQAYKEKYGET